jgi:hypothetical protein
LRESRLTGTDDDGWLLPGHTAGTHITAERPETPHPLRHHQPRQRHAALLALAARLPAPILAERLGFHPARATQWVRAAGATHADYVALRQAP